MKVIIREIRIRNQIEYIVDDSDGLMPERRMKLILEALYNSILTNSEVLERAKKREEDKNIIVLREAVEEFLKSDDENISEDEKKQKIIALKEIIGKCLSP